MTTEPTGTGPIVTGPGYRCRCKPKSNRCLPCDTTEERARLFAASQRRFLVRTGRVTYGDR
jgi:hypothetical protein